MCERQRRIYLAGDSTVQSYTKVMEPQTGWGQVFYEYFKGMTSVWKGSQQTAALPRAGSMSFLV